MKNYLGRMVLLVNDYESAAEFYKVNFGFKSLFDETTDDGQRYLHLGTTKEQCGIWLLKAEGSEQENRIGNQTAGQPALVIYTSSVHEQYTRMLKNGVRMKGKPVITHAYSYFHCYDSSGNECIVTEIKDSD